MTQNSESIEEAARQTLMRQAVSQAAEHGRELQQICPSVSGLLREGRPQPAMEQLRLLLTGLGAIAQAVHLTAPLQGDHSSNLELAELQQVLNPVVSALENRDHVLLADVLDYEVTPLLERWTSELESIAGENSEGPGPNA